MTKTTPHPGLSHNTFLKVPFFDVDSMNIVWHGHYVKYLEIARCELLDKIGYNYQAMAESGYSFPIVEMSLKYVKPLFFEQQIQIQTTLAEWENRIKIQYLIKDAQSGERLTSAVTTQASVEVKSKQLRLECPKVLIDKINTILATPTD